MQTVEKKCVMVIDEALPLGIIANTAAILGATLGKQQPDLVGVDVTDKTGNEHLGIVDIPIPILKGNAALIKEIREKLYAPEFSEMLVIDFSDVAQSCNVYDEFIAKMSHTEAVVLQYFGIALCGSKKLVNKLTGNMPLMR